MSWGPTFIIKVGPNDKIFKIKCKNNFAQPIFQKKHKKTPPFYPTTSTLVILCQAHRRQQTGADRAVPHPQTDRELQAHHLPTLHDHPARPHRPRSERAGHAPHPSARRDHIQAVPPLVPSPTERWVIW